MSAIGAIAGGVSALVGQNLLDKYKLGSGDGTTIKDWTHRAMMAILEQERLLTSEASFVTAIREWDQRLKDDITTFPFHEHEKLQVNGQLGQKFKNEWRDYAYNASGNYKDYLLSKDLLRMSLLEAGIPEKELNKNPDTNITGAEGIALNHYKSNIGPLKFLSTWEKHYSDVAAAVTAYKRGWQKAMGENDAAAVHTNLRNPLDMTLSNSDLLVAMDKALATPDDFARSYTFEMNLAGAMQGGSGMFANKAYGGSGPITVMMHEDIINVTHDFKGQSYLFLEKLKNHNTPGYDTIIPILNLKTEQNYTAYEYAVDVMKIARYPEDLPNSRNPIENMLGKEVKIEDMILSSSEKAMLSPQELSEKVSLNHLIHYTATVAQRAESSTASQRNLGNSTDYGQMRSYVEYLQAAVVKAGIDLPVDVYYSKVIHDANGKIDKDASIVRPRDTYPLATKKHELGEDEKPNPLADSNKMLTLVIKQIHPVPNERAPERSYGRDIFLAQFYVDCIAHERRHTESATAKLAMRNRYLSTFRFDTQNDHKIAEVSFESSDYPQNIDSRSNPIRNPKIVNQNELDKRIGYDAQSNTAERSILEVVRNKNEVVNADWQMNTGVRSEKKFHNLEGDRTSSPAISNIAADGYNQLRKTGFNVARESFKKRVKSSVTPEGLVGKGIDNAKHTLSGDDDNQGRENKASENIDNNYGSSTGEKTKETAKNVLSTAGNIAGWIIKPGKAITKLLGDHGAYSALSTAVNFVWQVSLLHFGVAKCSQSDKDIVNVLSNDSARAFHKEVYAGDNYGVHVMKNDTSFFLQAQKDFYINGSKVDINRHTKIDLKKGDILFDKLNRYDEPQVSGVESKTHDIKLDSDKMFTKYSSTTPWAINWAVPQGAIPFFDESATIPKLKGPSYNEERTENLSQKSGNIPSTNVTQEKVSVIGIVDKLKQLVSKAAQTEVWSDKVNNNTPTHIEKS